jgi:O-antigen/teichoic acid export membrane protein
VVRILAAVSVAPLAVLVVVAPDFVPVVLGDQWDEAIPVIQILAWVGIVQALQSLSVDVLMARDRARTIFRFSLVLVTCHLAAFAVGLNWGVIGVSVAFAISTTLVEPWQTILAARALGVSPLVFLRAISGVFQAAAGMCVVTLGVRLALIDAGAHQAVTLVVCLAVAAIVYLVLCAWRVPELASEARAVLRRRSPGGQRLSVPAAPAES